MVKVLHLSTSDSGGAGKAALRIHQGLLNEGIESYFLCLHKRRFDVPNVVNYSIFDLPKENILKRLKKRVSSYLPSKAKKLKNAFNKLNGNYEYFSFPFSSLNLHDHVLIKKADIIHLHWVSDFLDYESFFKKIAKPIVWTLHDMNPFLGGFHYSIDLQRNEIYQQLDHDLLQFKVNTYKTSSITKVICDSKWLLERALESKVFIDKDLSFINYGIDTNLYKPLNQCFAKEVLKLDPNVTTILFAAHDVNVYRKGFDLLVNALTGLDQKYNLLVLGEYIPTLNFHNNCKFLGKVDNEEFMSLIYSAADVFIMPSRQEAFGNVMLESLCCGTPVISFKTGGPLDIIVNNETGIIVETLNSEELKSAINYFIINSDRFDRKKVRNSVSEKNNLSNQALIYKEVYNEIITNQFNLSN